MGTTRHFRVGIIGAGFSGLGAAIRLQQTGVTDFALFERAKDVGGVWRDNTYPGAACDVQSHLYSFSFAQNASWTRSYSPQREIHAYLCELAERFSLRSHCRFEHDLREASWDEGAQLWRIATSKGDYTANVLIAAAGALSDPAIPRLPGLAGFKGKVMHSARWDHDLALEGKRVAVVGTGASSIQFVPAIQPKVAKLVLFQRTPPWILPRRDREIPPILRKLFRAVPQAQSLTRGGIYAAREMMALGFMNPRLLEYGQKLAEAHLKRQVPEPILRAKLTPNYTMGCKRILLSDDYLPALAQPNVEVVTSAIQSVTESTVIGADGSEHAVDALIFGTGFHVTDLPIGHQIRGRDGRTLAQLWAGSPRAHLGTSVAGYPNLFILQGPNTGLGHTSVLTMIESQIEHVLRAIQYLDQHQLAAVEPALEAQDRFLAQVDSRMGRTVWAQGGCSSWYVDATGRNSTLWPGFTFTYKRRVEQFDPTEYVAIAKGDGRATA